LAVFSSLSIVYITICLNWALPASPQLLAWFPSFFWWLHADFGMVVAFNALVLVTNLLFFKKVAKSTTLRAITYGAFVFMANFALSLFFLPLSNSLIIGFAGTFGVWSAVIYIRKLDPVKEIPLQSSPQERKDTIAHLHSEWTALLGSSITSLVALSITGVAPGSLSNLNQLTYFLFLFLAWGAALLLGITKYCHDRLRALRSVIVYHDA